MINNRFRFVKEFWVCYLGKMCLLFRLCDVIFVVYLRMLFLCIVEFVYCCCLYYYIKEVLLCLDCCFHHSGRVGNCSFYNFHFH